MRSKVALLTMFIGSFALAQHGETVKSAGKGKRACDGLYAVQATGGLARFNPLDVPSTGRVLFRGCVEFDINRGKNFPAGGVWLEYSSPVDYVEIPAGTPDLEATKVNSAFPAGSTFMVVANTEKPGTRIFPNDRRCPICVACLKQEKKEKPLRSQKDEVASR